MMHKQILVPAAGFSSDSTGHLSLYTQEAAQDSEPDVELPELTLQF